MKLGDLLTEGCVVMGFQAPDKWKAIDSLVERMVSGGRLRAERQQTVLEALIAREHIASTGMENGLALPHASVQDLEEPTAALGISSDGIPFQSEDGKPARLVMLVVIPKRSVHLHVRTLAAVARLMNYEEMRDALLNARSPREVLGIIKREEEKELV